MAGFGLGLPYSTRNTEVGGVEMNWFVGISHAE